MKSPQYDKFFIFVLFISLVASCLPAPSPTTETPHPTTTETIPAPTFTPTGTPTTEKVYFLSADQASQRISTDALLSSLTQRAGSIGWQVFTISNLSPQDIDPGTRLVVAVSPDPNLEALSMDNPDVQFLAIGISGLTPSPNLSIIGPEGFREDRIAFIAGYISAVLTKDWRIGIINQTSSDSIERVHGSFVNGMVYYCGLCRLTYPPYYDYPILTALPEEASESHWGEAAQLLISQSVETAFIFSNEVNPSTLDYLLENEVLLLGVQTPPDDYADSWATTIRSAPEQALETHWDELVSGQGGWVEEIPIVLDHIQEELFSPGRQALVQEILQDLVNGYIATGYAQEGQS